MAALDQQELQDLLVLLAQDLQAQPVLQALQALQDKMAAVAVAAEELVR
jgi:hypothetical protein